MTSKLPVNMLLDIHTAFSKLPVKFREMVSEECSFSTPTFYRKMRCRDKPDPNSKGKIIPALSNAEKEAIHRMAEIAVAEINAFMDNLSIK
ncbi:hypothetical protein QFZ51_002715 [Chitinophaga sp. W3I9]|uniref:hypothetical protein n=1 Tax=Chitinophaga sp. W3I9 TaxID=3373924 RepID=UPI003D1D13B6